MRYHKYPRLFFPQSLELNLEVKLPKHQSHYLINVMRRKLADKIILFNAESGEFLAEVMEANKNATIVKVVKKLRDFNKGLDITLVYSPVKNVKDEFIVQKAAELGVSLVQPCIFSRTIRPKTKADRLVAVAIEAAEQCERLDVPEVRGLEDFSNIFSEIKDKYIILCDETGQGKPVNEALSKLDKGNQFVILVGPEGGFTDSEIEQVYSLSGVTGIGLGPRILRADTAIITALAIVQNYLGDFGELPDFRNVTR